MAKPLLRASLRRCYRRSPADARRHRRWRRRSRERDQAPTVLGVDVEAAGSRLIIEMQNELLGEFKQGPPVQSHRVSPFL